jgi:hypothetical protein
VIAPRHDTAASIRFTDCLASIDSPWRQPLNYEWGSEAGTGFEAPRTIYAGSPPQKGTWRVGDQALNRQPKAGSYVGWVCVAAGSPGEWRPFGLIA